MTPDERRAILRARVRQGPYLTRSTAFVVLHFRGLFAMAALWTIAAVLYAHR